MNSYVPKTFSVFIALERDIVTQEMSSLECEIIARRTIGAGVPLFTKLI